MGRLSQTEMVRILSEVSDALEGGAGECRYLARRITPALTATPAESVHNGGTSMAKKAKTKTVRKAAFVFTKEEQGPGETETVQLAVVIPRRVGLWFRHYALDEGLSMAELIRRILHHFMTSHGGGTTEARDDESGGDRSSGRGR
jgi:hypothetical protein